MLLIFDNKGGENLAKLSLRKLREDAGLTRADVFKATGVLETTLFNAERDQNKTSIKTLVALARFFGVKLDDLVDMDVF